MRQGRIQTSIETEFEAGGARAKGRIMNVSEGGLFVGSGTIPGQGENAALRFRAPGGDEIKLSGLVWWTTEEGGVTRHRAPGFGVRLLDESEEWQELCARLERSANGRSRRLRR